MKRHESQGGLNWSLEKETLLWEVEGAESGFERVASRLTITSLV